MNRETKGSGYVQPDKGNVLLLSKRELWRKWGRLSPEMIKRSRASDNAASEETPVTG